MSDDSADDHRLHGDDEQLSAHLDGEGGPGVDAHVAGCATCRARAAQLAAVARAVASPPPPVPDATVERAVAAAVAAWEEERNPGAATRSADVLPLAPASSRRLPPTWVLGLAAAVLAVLVAVPLLVAGTRSENREEVAGRVAAPPPEAAEAAESPLAFGADLGDQSDPAVLRRVVAAALDAGAAAGTAPVQLPARSEDGAAAPGEDGAAPEAEQGGAPVGLDDAAVISRCARSLRSNAGNRLGPLAYGATLRWQATPAVVLGYRITGDAGRAHQVFVMAREDCRLLVFQRL